MVTTLRPDAAAAALPDFPQGGGELGRLIRAMDWSQTSLGPIATWPESLRMAVNIVLQSPLPLVMLWGREGVMIYNDAYSVFAGQRHPRLLGSKVLEGWAEVADFNAHVLKVGLSGGTLSFRDQELTLHRNEVPEQVWMDLNYGPILDESGRPAGVLAIVTETTEQVLSARRQAFLYSLGERMRDKTDMAEMLAAAMSALAEHLGADRASWAELDEDEGLIHVKHEWAAPDLPSLLGSYRVEDFHPGAIAALRAGEVVHYADADEGVGGRTREALGPTIGGTIGAGLGAPIVRGGRLLASLSVHSRSRRHWRGEEQDLMREVAARTWAAVRRIRAEVAMRESEARFRALVSATSDVIYRMSADWAEGRLVAGLGAVSLNEPDGPVGDWIGRFIHPEDRDAVRDEIRQATAERRPYQLEHRVRMADGGVGWVFSRAVPLFDPDGEIVEWFGAASDITARREAEEHLRLVVNELNHRVKNNLAMTQAIAAQTFRNAQDLGLARADFEARIMALAQANDLLTGERWAGANLRGVVIQALEPHTAAGGPRLEIDGPHVSLTPKTALSLSMALHELATNALKHGAWSAPEGKVRVAWSVDGPEAAQSLTLVWSETEGPPVTEPTRRGFGSRLIERGLAAELAGSVRLEFRPEGLSCRVEAPLGRLADE